MTQITRLTFEVSIICLHLVKNFKIQSIYFARSFVHGPIKSCGAMLNDSDYWTQHGHDESNKIVEDMEKTIAASLFDTYRVRNHLVPNPTNSKLIRLKK